MQKYSGLFLVLALLILTGGKAFGFGVDDHRLITELAIEELQACRMLPPLMSGKSAGLLVQANLREDNYLLNGLKKLFNYSHFYNPLRPLRRERHRAFHAGQAVHDYTANAAQLAASGGMQRDILENAGMITHMIQDASSPAHALWINHGPFDGFENKVKVTREELSASKPSCNQISLAGLQTPLQIIQAAGLAALKQLEEPVKMIIISADGREPRHASEPWSKSFFSNKALYTQKAQVFLKNFNLLQPDLETPVSDDEDQPHWNKKYLAAGSYGPLSDGIVNVTLRGDNFGKTSFDLSENKIHVDYQEYLNLRKTLMRQSVLNTQRLLLWLGQQRDGR